MKLRFINPPIFDLVGQQYKLNQAVGGPLLSAILRGRGHDACYVDGEALGWSMADVSRYLAGERPDAIGITVTNLNWDGASRMIELIKAQFPYIWVAVGGPEVTARPYDARMLGADGVGIGECDMGIGNIFEEKLGYYQPNGTLPDVNALPLPAWEYSQPLPTKYIGNMPRFETPEVCSLWMRGCPGLCTFCSNPVFSRVSIRFRSPDNIVAELEKLQAMGARHVFVYSDELIGMSPRQEAWLLEVCEAIIQAKLRLTYKTQGRVGKYATSEALQAMARAGFKAIMWGIESLSPQVLAAIKKGITPEDVWETLAASHEAGIKNWGFFMVGCPGEHTEDFQLTVKGIAALQGKGLLDYKQVNICTPSPGTALWEEAKENGWLVIKSPEKAERFHQTPVLAYPYASAQDIKRRLAVLQCL